MSAGTVRFGANVRFISKDNLIKTKKATGRPQDLLDLARLEMQDK